MKGKRQTIRVYSWEGDKQGDAVAAVAYGNLALYHATYWIVVHVPTGIQTLFFRREHAREALEGLLRLGDWAAADRAALQQLSYYAEAQTYIQGLRARLEAEKDERITAKAARKVT